MTSGTKRTGFTYQTQTDSGLANVYFRYAEKTWSGTNRSAVPKVYEIRERVKPYLTFSVYKGEKIAHLRYRTKSYKVRVRPPRVLLEQDHPYTMTKSAKHDTVFSYRTLSGGSWSQWRTGTGGNTFGSPAAYPLWNSNNELGLIGKLREKVVGSDFNAAIFLKEGETCLDMITSAATRIYQGYKAARRGDLIGARRFLTQGDSRIRKGPKVLASNWLELQYGWLPLLKDVEGAAQALAHHLNYPATMKYVVRSGRVGGHMKTSSPSNTSWGTSDCETRGQLSVRLTEKDVVKLIGMADPLSVAWESIPYSFVIDWFIPIGNYLASRGLAQSLTGTFVKTLTTRWNASDLIAVPKGLELSGPQCAFDHVKVVRTVTNDLQVPLPTIKRLADVPSWQRAANAVALLVQLKK